MSRETVDEPGRGSQDKQEEKGQETEKELKYGVTELKTEIEIALETKEREDKDPDSVTITSCPLTPTTPTLAQIPTPTSTINFISEKAPVLSLSLQIPGTGLLAPTTTSEPSSSAPSSEPTSPNPLADSDILSPPSETPPSSSSAQASASSLSLSASTSASTTAGTTSEQCLVTASARPSSSGGGLNVKFAPLPELAPRKRRSSTPLGMAARGQLMRRRKQNGHMSVQQQQLAALAEAAAANPSWTAEDREEERLRQEEIAARYAHYQASATALAAREEEALLEEEEQEERERERRGELMKLERPRGGDVAVAERERSLGKTVKGFLRRVGRSRDAESAASGKKDSGKDTEIALKRRKSDIGKRPRGTSSPTATSPPEVPPVPALPLRPILATISSNGPAQTSSRMSMSISEEVSEVRRQPEPVREEEESGGVWEEEIGGAFPMNVGQTETIVEGRAVYASVETPTTTTTKVEGGTKSKVDSKPAKSSASPTPKNLPVKAAKVVSTKS
ncbi:hypothetical protein JR316_0003877 [Psilocybe cubensis]|uniref:Uncharacterized protein n=2 Tax=Psilocybe cubensis TaxID=181762 RepID=A0A8H7Y5N6_PSICU|nr:hypothetical protein JR316_0003877 [Psilocybe cubensis]KAH9484396.1 hypothetical protein JR316_0003877 [Psilocybe cubensis]